MGCVPSHERKTAKNQNPTTTNNTLIFTIDERLKLKEVWIIVKQYGFKKLGDDIMSRYINYQKKNLFQMYFYILFRALARNGTLKTYWQHAANNEQNSLLTFDENSTDFMWKQCLKQHGYKLLDKIDQLIMIMVTRVSTTDSNDSVLNDYFHRIAETHVQYKIKQDHVDVRTAKKKLL